MFRLKSTFGIDYSHQANITSDIPEKLRQSVLKELNKCGYEDEVLNLKVEFKVAGPSSLDLDVIAEFSGAAAKNHNKLERLIQRASVDACNDYGWVIPFTQIMLHKAEPA